MVVISSGPAAPGAIVAPGCRPFLISWFEILLAPGSPSPPLKDAVEQDKTGSADNTANEKFEDEDYPAYSMGSAAQILGTTAGFLRSLDEAKLLIPHRSEGGHRRYSRYQLRVAARARELVDRGTSLDAACRIIILEDQLAEAHALNAELHRRLDDQDTPPGDHSS